MNTRYATSQEAQVLRTAITNTRLVLSDEQRRLRRGSEHSVEVDGWTRIATLSFALDGLVKVTRRLRVSTSTLERGTGASLAISLAVSVTTGALAWFAMPVPGLPPRLALAVGVGHLAMECTSRVITMRLRRTASRSVAVHDPQAAPSPTEIADQLDPLVLDLAEGDTGTATELKAAQYWLRVLSKQA